MKTQGPPSFLLNHPNVYLIQRIRLPASITGNPMPVSDGLLTEVNSHCNVDGHIHTKDASAELACRGC